MQVNHTYLAPLLVLLLASPLLAQQGQNYDSDVAEFVAMLDQQIQSGPQVEVASVLAAQSSAAITDTEISLVNCDY